MKRALLVIAAVVAIAGVALAGLLLTAADEEPTFTEADAEAAVTKALKRCKHNLRAARRVECRDVGNGFACRADGRFVAGFDYPDPEQPELRVMC